MPKPFLRPQQMTVQQRVEGWLGALDLEAVHKVVIANGGITLIV